MSLCEDGSGVYRSIGISVRPRLLFDVSGLVQWYAWLRNPSGIQRVTENILGSFLIEADGPAECIARPPGSKSFYRVPSSLILDLLNPDARNSAIAQLRRLYAGMIATVPVCRLATALRAIHIPYLAWGWTRIGISNAVEITAPSAEDVVIGLGDFWCYRDHVGALVDLKRQTGARLIHMIHDLFGLEQPEWSHPHYGPEFIRQLEALAPHVDRWLVNSRFVAGTLHAYLAAGASCGTPDVVVVPMGWNTAFAPSATALCGDTALLARFGLNDRPYALHVGSVEPRKNIPALIEAFRRLRSAGKVDVPICILIGQNGWKAQEIRRHIKDANRDGEVVRWLRDVSDGELAAFYRGARFTIVPSRIEGWGLAAQESLAHGTPCIASRAGGLLEAGLDMAVYVDPDDPQALYDAIAHWVDDPAAVASTRRHIRNRLRAGEPLATWHAAARCVREACAYPSAARTASSV